jgi:hypothetical protein
MPEKQLTRREVLKAGAIAAGSLLLASCGVNSEKSADTATDLPIQLIDTEGQLQTFYLTKNPQHPEIKLPLINSYPDQQTKPGTLLDNHIFTVQTTPETDFVYTYESPEGRSKKHLETLIPNKTYYALQVTETNNDEQPVKNFLIISKPLVGSQQTIVLGYVHSQGSLEDSSKKASN